MDFMLSSERSRPETKHQHKRQNRKHLYCQVGHIPTQKTHTLLTPWRWQTVEQMSCCVRWAGTEETMREQKQPLNEIANASFERTMSFCAECLADLNPQYRCVECCACGALLCYTCTKCLCEVKKGKTVNNNNETPKQTFDRLLYKTIAPALQELNELCRLQKAP